MKNHEKQGQTTFFTPAPRKELHEKQGQTTFFTPAPRKELGRFTVPVLIASLGGILLWLLGTAAERCGLHERMRPGSPQRRAYSRVFLARRLLTLEGGRNDVREGGRRHRAAGSMGRARPRCTAH
jgi:hypothetical protein